MSDLGEDFLAGYVSVLQARVEVLQRSVVFSPTVVRSLVAEELAKVGDQTILSFKMHFLANTIHRTVENVTYVPRTWVDAIKERFFKQSRFWWLRPLYRQIETEIHFVHACPHLDWEDRGKMAHIAFLTPHQ